MLEFLVKHYARQFTAIHFWKCPRVADLAPLEDLTDLTHAAYYWNQKCTRLWNFRKTAKLRGLHFDDFSKLLHLVDLECAESLEELEFGNAIRSKCSFHSLAPLSALRELKHLHFNAKRIDDDRIEPLANLTQLTSLDFPSNLFGTEQVAWLKARLPAVEARVLAPCHSLARPISRNGKQLDTLVIGRKKPFLDSTRDAKRLRRYCDEFDSMLAYFTSHPSAAPTSYASWRQVD